MEEAEGEGINKLYRYNLGTPARIVYFEGTYTAEFSGNPRPTPRYDYNQILYRLDLADPGLAGVRAG